MPRAEPSRKVSGFDRHRLLRQYAACAAPCDSHDAVHVHMLPVVLSFEKPTTLNVFPCQLVDVYVGSASDSEKKYKPATRSHGHASHRDCQIPMALGQRPNQNSIVLPMYVAPFVPDAACHRWDWNMTPIVGGNHHCSGTGDICPEFLL
jgi:hypothetical protein